MTEILTSEIEEAMLGKTRTASIPGQASSTAPSTDRVQLLGAIEAVNAMTKILSTNRMTRADLFALSQAGISLEPLRPPRPDYCCGKCPQTMTGWDCTCPSNPRCTKETK